MEIDLCNEFETLKNVELQSPLSNYLYQTIVLTGIDSMRKVTVQEKIPKEEAEVVVNVLQLHQSERIHSEENY